MGDRAIFTAILIGLQTLAAFVLIGGLRLQGRWAIGAVAAFVLFSLPLPYLMGLAGHARQPSLLTAALVVRPVFAWHFNWLAFLLFLAPVIIIGRAAAWMAGWQMLVSVLRWSVLGLVGLWGLATIIGLAGTLRPPKITTLEVRIPGLPPEQSGLRLVQLSDPHVAWWNSRAEMERIGEMIMQLQPDLFVLTGDMVDHHPDYVHVLADSLEELKPRLGRYAIIGNHDVYTGAEAVAERMQARGFHMLRNQCLGLEERGARLALLGMEDSGANWTGADPWEEMIPHYLADCPAGLPVILLAHRPSAFSRVEGRPVALTLTGHTHGGQLRLPFGLPGLAHLGFQRPSGLYRVAGQTLYTSRGTGTVGWPFRLNCPPEITLFILRAPERTGSR